jgi:hypothetical protein
MAASVVLGQRVQLRTDSYFAGKSPNPPAGTIGTVTLLDNDWVSVLWDGYTKEYNYRVTELDWYGAPPTNSGEWGWARAFQDAKNQPVATILDRTNPLSPNYDQPFDVMYKMFINTKVVADRISVAALLPQVTSGNRDSVSWNATSQFPAGTLSVSGVYNNNNAYSCWKMIDGSSTSYWYPTAAKWQGSWWQVAFDTQVYVTKLEFTTNQGDYRPKRIRVDVGSTVADLQSAGEFVIPPSPGTAATTEVIDLPAIGYRKVIRVTVLEMYGVGLAGYPIFYYQIYGVKT